MWVWMWVGWVEWGWVGGVGSMGGWGVSLWGEGAEGGEHMAEAARLRLVSSPSAHKSTQGSHLMPP